MGRTSRIITSLGIVIAVGMLALPVLAAEPPRPLPFSTIEDTERTLIEKLLDSPHWPFRVFALRRLERFSGAERDALVRARLGDERWQVRCFALHVARRLAITIPDDSLAEELDGRVIRAALGHGFDVPAEHVEQSARQLMRTARVEDLLLGLEITASSEVEPLRKEAVRRTRRLIRNLDDALAVRYARRLARLVRAHPAPETAQQWSRWLAKRRGQLTLSAPAPVANGATSHRPLAAELDAEGFSRLVDYLDSLRQRDLEMVIVMDATSSMIPMVNEARAGVDTLIVFLDDISRTMRVGFVAYRDHDNEPVWEGHAFTSDVAEIRDFLFGVRITGGRDLPEAVYQGLAACAQLEWNRDATRQIVLVGDARPHDRDAYRLTGLLESYREAGVIVHAAHVPMRFNETYRASLTPPQARARQQEIAEHNVRTKEAFSEIARLGGGEKVSLRDAEDLVPAIMHLTINETWWPAFDEFYERYLELCR
ncbi:MAG: VWA domain-containing protein [Planctomycetes bacterium]|nr:VWA domain-containing protein [Planctomycetota bacterium]